MQAVEQLRSVVRALYGYALQTQIVTTEEDYTVFAKTNKILITDAIKQRAKRLADELVFFTMLMEKQSKVL
jgi:NAD(P)H-dependent FMN reductase